MQAVTKDVESQPAPSQDSYPPIRVVVPIMITLYCGLFLVALVSSSIDPRLLSQRPLLLCLFLLMSLLHTRS